MPTISHPDHTDKSTTDTPHTPVMTMPFGRHKGVALDELDDTYVLWLLTLPDLRDPLLTAIHHEADRRNADRPTSPAAQVSTIHTSLFQPFESRVGRDQVVRLDFGYDAMVIGHLKAALAEHHSCEQAAGGWLPKFKCWFCEVPIWPMVRQRLRAAGVVIIEEA